MKGKTRTAIVVAMATLLLAMPLVVGDGPTPSSGEVGTTVTVANEAPFWDTNEGEDVGWVLDVDGVDNQIDPNPSTTRLVEVRAIVTDNNGAADISSVNCTWLHGEEVKYTGSGLVDKNTMEEEFTKVEVMCNQTLNYNDPFGEWTVRFSVQDKDEAWTEENATAVFDYQRAAFFDLNLTSITWSDLELDSTENPANEIVRVNNTGNGDIHLGIKGADLKGQTHGDWYIGIDNVSAQIGDDNEWQAYTEDYVLYNDGTNDFVLSIDAEADINHIMNVPGVLPDQEYIGSISLLAEAS